MSPSSSPRRASRATAPLLLALLVAAPALVGLGYAALVVVGLVGFTTPASGFTLARLARVLGEPAVWASLAWTLWVAAASTTLATLGAVAVALAFRGARLADRLGRALAVVPLPVPHLVAAAAGLLVLGQSGLLARLGHAAGLVPSPAAMPALVYDRWGIGLVLTLAWKELPFLALLAASVLATRGRALEEVARGLGAGPAARLRWVVWPLLWRGLLPGVIAVFVFAAGSFETALLLAPSDPLALPLLTAERYENAALEARPDAFVLVLLAFGVSAVAVAAHEWARARWEGLEG